MPAAYKSYDRSRQQKAYFFTQKNELVLGLLQMFSTLYKNIFRLLLTVVAVEWMHSGFKYTQ